ncbi:MAG: hypothetical protein J5794_01020 [Lachnospiraceae bacterium]|nr:hypothetical protein [Lachnospiraceae bacterium]
MKKITKIFAALLALLMIAGALAACTQQTPTTAPTTKPTTAPTVKPGESTAPTDAAPTEPQETEYTGHKKKRDKNTIIVGVPRNSKVEDYETNEWTLWLEETTGINLEFEYFSSTAADYRSQLATRIANWENEEMPDLLWGFTLSDDLIKSYGDDGYFIDLAPYYNDKEKSKNFWEQMDRIYSTDPAFVNDIMTKLTDQDTGAMYAAARIEYGLIDPMHYQLYINQRWLDKLHLKAPTNLDELYDVLVAFRDQDPNGNGLKDEIPLIGNGSSTVYGQAVDWLLNFFVYEYKGRWWNVDDNQNLYLPYNTNEYREGLKFVNKLWSEGLISNSYFATANKDIKALMSADEATIGIVSCHQSVIYTTDAPLMWDYVPLKLVNYAVKDGQSFNKRNYITADCQYPDQAWKVLEAMNSIEGSNRGYYGVKGRDWDDADPGAMSIFGWPAELKDINHIWGNITNEHWGVVNFFAWWSENEYTQMSDMTYWEKTRIERMVDFYKYYEECYQNNNPKYFLKSSLVYSTTEKEATQDIRSNVQKAINEAYTGFITGEGYDINSDKDWNDYVKLLDDLGLKTWQEQAQRLYDAQQRK